MERYNLELRNLANGNLTSIQGANMKAIRSMLNNLDKNQMENNDRVDVLEKTGKKVKVSKNYYEFINDDWHANHQDNKT